MLKLISCELVKLKRKKFIPFVILSSFLFPPPVALMMLTPRMMARYGTKAELFDDFYQFVLGYGVELLLPCVIGVIAAMLFFMERDNDTFKNLRTIPVTSTQMILAKIIVLFLFGLIYCLSTAAVAIVCGSLIAEVGGLGYKLWMAVEMGIFVTAGTLPLVVLVVFFSKSYILYHMEFRRYAIFFPMNIILLWKGENIVFRYPGQKEPILNGLNFTFYAGKTYALVGENGCGKSTLIKLLMEFYQPDSGSITIDGVNIQELDFAKVQQYFSAVFQDFNRYDYTIKENIFISSLEKESPGDAIYRAAREAEMDTWILSNPDAYYTKLGDLEDGGMDLSGGQWQRLAIARMLYRKAGIYIWDEPAAAMDPLAESRLYADFLHKRSERCANIFVTHRLGAAVKADEICVLENGRFVEQGNHAQLLQEKDGLYRRMFQAQKGMYE